MKKKIAVFANGLSPAILLSTIKGIRNCYDSDQPDIFVFLSHSMGTQEKDDAAGENSIYRLPDLSVYDGVIVCANNITDPEISKEICARAESMNIPLVTLGIPYKDYTVITIDNVTGMIELVDHLIEHHGVKTAAFICGQKEQVDSAERLKIVEKEFRRHGLAFKDSMVYYGNWQYSDITACVDKIINSPEGLPDAIFCANDSTALIAITELALKGIKVPDDIIVTGYDGVDAAKQFYPSITSVKQDFEKVGEACIKGLFGANEIRSKHIKLLSSIDIAESCGCDKYNEFEQLRNKFCQESFGKTLRNDMLTTNEKMIDAVVLSADNIGKLKHDLTEHYANNHTFEGDSFYMAVDAHIFSNKTMHFSEVLSENFESKMTSVVAFREGRQVENTSIDRKTLIPGYDNIKGSHTFFLLPIHIKQYTVGYITLVDYPYLVKDRLVFGYISTINQTFFRLRSTMYMNALNKNLTELYHKDAMTGLYNRFGFEEIAVPLFEKNTENNKRTMICFLDINYMKHINDVYGHIQGDNAILAVADAIKANERKNWIAIRYGGDEFLIIAQCADEDDAYSIKKNILSEVEYNKGLKKLPYDLGVSCGFVVSEPGSGKSLSEYIKDADEVMYMIKKEVHTKGMDRRRR